MIYFINFYVQDSSIRNFHAKKLYLALIIAYNQYHLVSHVLSNVLNMIALTYNLAYVVSFTCIKKRHIIYTQNTVKIYKITNYIKYISRNYVILVHNVPLPMTSY